MFARGVVMACLVVCCAGGCMPRVPSGFDSPSPSKRLDAVVSAAATEDESAIPDLVGMLDSDDPAARLLAIRALERITGETLGYSYDAPEWQRRRAIRRWVGYVEENLGKALERPARDPSGGSPRRGGWERRRPDPDSGNEPGR